MITITEKAQRSLFELITSKGKGSWVGLRLQVKGGVPGAWQSDFRPVHPGEEKKGDHILNLANFQVFIDPESYSKLEGTNIDVVPTFSGPNFKIDYPQPKWDDPIAQKLQNLINDRINPGLASHGGYTALLGVDNGTATLIMGGGCQGCGLSSATLRQGIEVMIKENIPEIHTIMDKTDHDAGTNPYYRSDDLINGDSKSPLVQK